MSAVDRHRLQKTARTTQLKLLVDFKESTIETYQEILKNSK